MKIWREETPEIDDSGDIIKGGMWDHQRDWWNLPNFIKALIAGYGSGKTFIGGKRSIALAMHNAPSPHLIVSPSYKMARRVVIPTVNALLKGKQSLYPELWWKYNKSAWEYTIRWRGREAFIWIASGDEPESLKGPNVGSALVDEPFIQDEEVLTQMLARVRDPLARVKEIGLTGTPEQLNWGYDITYGDRADDFDIGIIHAHTGMNKALDPMYLETLLRAMTPEMAEAFLAGQFVNLMAGRTYYGFTRDANVRSLPDPGFELGVGMDFNIDPMAAIVFWVNGTHMHITNEIELPNADTYMMCKHIAETFVWPKKHPNAGECRVARIYPDASGVARKTSAPYGQSDFTIIKSFGYEVDAPPKNPHVRDRENSVNGKLRPAKGEPTLTIDPSCKKLIGYMEKFTNTNRNKEEYKRMTHLLDATGYPVHRMFPIHKPSVRVARVMGQ